MTIGSIGSVAQIDYQAQAPAARPQPPPAKPEAAHGEAGDRVQISSAAARALAANPAEGTETPAQTAQEAAAGDAPAMAKEAREKSGLQ